MILKQWSRSLPRNNHLQIFTKLSEYTILLCRDGILNMCTQENDGVYSNVHTGSTNESMKNTSIRYTCWTTLESAIRTLQSINEHYCLF